MEDCDDLNGDLDLSDEDGDGVTMCDGDCDDNDPEIQQGIATGLSPYCPNTDCLKLTRAGIGHRRWFVLIAPYEEEPIQCIVI